MYVNIYQRISTALWQQVSTILNSVPGGATKDYKQWRKTWGDIKKNVKNRYAKEKKHNRGTGGGPPMPNDKVLEIITPVSVDGNTKVPDPYTVFEFDDHIVDTPENPDPVDAATQNDEIEQDHTYTEPDTPSSKTQILEDNSPIMRPLIRKRYTKKSRLTDSIKNSHKFLNISEKGILSTEKYRNLNWRF